MDACCLWKIYIYSPWKIKSNGMLFKLFWYKAFVHRKLKLNHFSDEFHLNISSDHKIQKASDWKQRWGRGATTKSTTGLESYLQQHTSRRKGNTLQMPMNCAGLTQVSLLFSYVPSTRKNNNMVYYLVYLRGYYNLTTQSTSNVKKWELLEQRMAIVITDSSMFRADSHCLQFLSPHLPL